MAPNQRSALIVTQASCHFGHKSRTRAASSAHAVPLQGTRGAVLLQLRPGGEREEHVGHAIGIVLFVCCWSLSSEPCLALRPSPLLSWCVSQLPSSLHRRIPPRSLFSPRAVFSLPLSLPPFLHHTLSLSFSRSFSFVPHPLALLSPLAPFHTPVRLYHTRPARSARAPLLQSVSGSRSTMSSTRPHARPFRSTRSGPSLALAASGVRPRCHVNLL